MYNEYDEQRDKDGYVWNQEPSKQPKPEARRGWSTGKIIALALSCALLGGAVGAAGTVLGTRTLRQDGEKPENTVTIQEGQRENTVLNSVSIDTGKQMTPAEVYAANVNSTVGIVTETTTNYWGYQTTSAAAGSGFILSDDGYILTNYHVVSGSDVITVSLYDGKTFDAELIGYDEGNDIAVLKVDAEGLTPVVLGDSANMNVGDSVVAIGNPLGELTFSLTAGAISAMDREVTMSSGVTMNLTQTDCAINSGNSGGALFNLYGEVIGVTNAKYSSNSGSGASIDNIAFAIPINSIRSIVESIIENGYISKPYIGVTVTDVSQETQSYGLPKGAAIRAVAEGSPAEAAGLQVNDIVTKVNETEITNRSDLVKIVGQAAVGDVLKLQVYRQGTNIEISVTVGEQIQSALEEAKVTPQNSNQPLNPFGFGGFGN